MLRIGVLQGENRKILFVECNGRIQIVIFQFLLCGHYNVGCRNHFVEKFRGMLDFNLVKLIKTMRNIESKIILNSKPKRIGTRIAAIASVSSLNDF